MTSYYRKRTIRTIIPIVFVSILSTKSFATTTSKTVSSSPLRSSSSFPSARPSYDNAAAPLSWNVDFLRTSIGLDDDGVSLLIHEVEISNRDHGVKILDENCDDELDFAVFEPFRTSTNAPGKPGFLVVRTVLKVNENEIRNADIWTEDGLSSGGSFGYCLLVSLYAGETVVVGRKRKINVNVNSVVDFSVGRVEDGSSSSSPSSQPSSFPSVSPVTSSTDTPTTKRTDTAPTDFPSRKPSLSSAVSSDEPTDVVSSTYRLTHSIDITIVIVSSLLLNTLIF